ncbi:unnamed protein product [Acanthoscelides obtectus]|uniref:Phorbol-ester/DAG-type domain-containing protein n=1 Tax=Acanthoscelides obtectus TaxID=200917 RepID=A0A9P0K7A6_ACAOB|nr:unnamed protein product [Acanthoscelides obtectus]CAK1672012.1 Differentially expressed in FDCP 8 homolog [Acanthoscelides obtectus]
MLHSPISGYCDHCTGAIWSVVQTWYECQDCGYSCHYKCLSSVVRECAHVVATERGTYEFDICPEEGLSTQQYHCAECNAALPLTIPKRISCLGRVIFQDSTWGDEPRLCDYTGRYYCMALPLGRASRGAGTGGPELGPGTSARLPGRVATVANHSPSTDYQSGEDKSEAVQLGARVGIGEEIEDRTDRNEKVPNSLPESHRRPRPLETRGRSPPYRLPGHVQLARPS